MKLIEVRPAEAVGLPVNALGQKQSLDEHVLNYREGKECFACGRKGHFKEDYQCPVKDKQCNNCGKRGHFKAKCQLLNREVPVRKPAVSRPRTNTNVPEEVESKNENLPPEREVFTVQTIKSKTGLVNLNVGGVVLPDVLIDSGAASNVVNKQTWQWLKRQNVVADYREHSKTLYAYGSSEPLTTVRTFTANK